MPKPQNIIAKISQNIKKKKWDCLVDNCDKKAINSHLIQQNGILNNISEKGHLYELKMTDAFKWSNKQKPFNFKKIGITKALSHPVFCNEHDTKIFKPIEQVGTDFNSYETFLLFSYRAVCAEIRKKQVNIEFYNRLINAETLTGEINKENFQLMLNGNELGITDLNKLKHFLETEIQVKDDNYVYFSFTYPKIDVYASAVFSGTDITYPRKDGGLDLKNIYIHILPLKKETLITVGYNINYTSKEIKKYCKSWSDLSNEKIKEKLTNLFTDNIENWGLSIKLYESLTNKNKEKYIETLMKNVNDYGVFQNNGFNLFE